MSATAFPGDDFNMSDEALEKFFAVEEDLDAIAAEPVESTALVRIGVGNGLVLGGLPHMAWSAGDVPVSVLARVKALLDPYVQFQGVGA